MVEEAAEDGVTWTNTARAHRLIYTARHFEHTEAEAGVYDQVENFGVGQPEHFRLEFADDLEELIRAEELFDFVLLPNGAAPHVDPAKVNVGAFVPLFLGNDWLFEFSSGSPHILRVVHEFLAPVY